MNLFDDYEEQEFQIIKFSSILAETGKALLLQTKKGSCWLPKKGTKLEEGVAIVEDWVNISYKKG